MPTDLLAAAGESSLNHPLTLVLERRRTDPAESVRDDEELAIARTWTQPTARTFTLGGAARLSSHVDDATIDSLLGVIGPTATSTRRLPGDVGARASAAIDGDPATAWTPAFDTAGNDALTYQLGRPITFNHLDLRVVADGRHSVPTHLRIEADGQPAASVTVPAVTDRPDARGADAAVKVPIELPEAVTGSTITVIVDEVREITTTDWFSNGAIRMPVGIAELGIAGLAAAAPTGAFDSGCRTDLLTIDGQSIGVELTGAMTDAEAGRPLTVTPCSPTDTLLLGEGEHVLRAAKGIDTGFDLDRLVLQSATDGNAPARISPLGAGHAAGPVVQVDHQGRTDASLTITNPTPGRPFWLVLGQSHNDGWTATADGHDLGSPQLVDGYANGWLVSTPAATVHVHLNWAPQRRVWIAPRRSRRLGVVLCLRCWPFRRPRTGPLAVEDPQPEPIRWDTFIRARGRDEPSVGMALLVGAGCGLFAAAVIGIVAGLVTAFVAATASSAPSATLVAGPRLTRHCWRSPRCTSSFARRGRVRPRRSSGRPSSHVHQVGWLAIAFLVVLVNVDAARIRVNRRLGDGGRRCRFFSPDDAWYPSDDAWPLP